MRLSSFSSKLTNNVGLGPAPVHDQASFQGSRRWSHICILCVRIVFGGIWTWNACLLGHYLTTQTASLYVRQMMTDSQQSRQHILPWSDFWQHIALRYPVGFILFCVVGVGLVACSLLCNLFIRLISATGSILALFFWSTQLVSLVPGIQAGDTGVLLVFLLAFLGFTLIAGYLPHAQYSRMQREKRGNRLPSFAAATMHTPHGTMPARSRRPVPGASLADIQTQTMNESTVANVRKKEVVGAYTRRFTSNND